MQTKKKSMLFPLVMIFLLLAPWISGCNSKCPPNGKWSTGAEVGLVGFDVSKCQIVFVVVAADISGAGNRYGGNFKQDYINSYGTTSTQFFMLECPIDANGQFKCPAELPFGGYQLTGEFLSSSEARGGLVLSQTMEFPTGFWLADSVSFTWSASPVK